MDEMDVGQVIELRARWMKRGEKNAVEIIPVSTLIEMADLIVCQAACLQQLDEGLTHLEEMLDSDRELSVGVHTPEPAIEAEVSVLEEKPATRSTPRLRGQTPLRGAKTGTHPQRPNLR